MFWETICRLLWTTFCKTLAWNKMLTATQSSELPGAAVRRAHLLEFLFCLRFVTKLKFPFFFLLFNFRITYVSSCKSDIISFNGKSKWNQRNMSWVKKSKKMSWVKNLKAKISVWNSRVNSRQKEAALTILPVGLMAVARRRARSAEQEKKVKLGKLVLIIFFRVG